MNKDKIAEIVTLRHNKMKELADPIFEEKQINRALYANEFHPDSSYEEDYTLSDSHVFPVIRNYMSRSNPANTKIRLDPRSKDDYEKRHVNQDIINWELGEMHSGRLFSKIYYSSFMNGKGYFKTGWKYEPAVEISENNEGKVTRRKILKDVVNRAHAEFVRFEDILVPNQNIPELRSQPYYIEMWQPTLGELMDENEYLEERGFDPYWDKKFIDRVKKSGFEKKLLDYQIDIVDDSEISKEEMAMRAATISMMCMHTIGGDVFYVPLKEDTVINKDTNNRYWHNHYPVADFTVFPEDDNYYSKSVVDIIGDYQIAGSEILNQTLTNLRQSNNNMWIAGTPAAQTPDWMFRTRPDGVIRVVGQVDQIQQIRVQDNSRNAMYVAQEVANRAEKTSGISSMYASGAGGTSINQTARGAQIIDQNIDTNMKQIVDNFGEQVIKVLAEDFLELNAQYITEEQTYYITGKKGVRDLATADPETISANFDVSVNTEALMKQTPASRQASLQNTIQILQNISNQSQGVVQVNLTPAVEALLDATPEMDSVDDVVTSVDEKAQRDISMLERGHMPEILVRDPHMELIQLASMRFEETEYPPEIQELFEQYVEKHLRFIQSQREIQQMSQPQMPQEMGAEGMGAAMGFDPGMADQQGTENQGYNLGQIV